LFHWIWGKFKDLNFSSNKISSIRSLNILNLKILDLSNNAIDGMFDFSTLKSLVSLDISLNRFKKFPSSLKFLVNLKELDISSNNIKIIDSKDINSLKNMESLNLERNNLKELPSDIFLLENLEFLDIRYVK
jgi:Leucine-rich repeat (LRR) protein